MNRLFDATVVGIVVSRLQALGLNAPVQSINIACTQNIVISS